MSTARVPVAGAVPGSYATGVGRGRWTCLGAKWQAERKSSETETIPTRTANRANLIASPRSSMRGSGTQLVRTIVVMVVLVRDLLRRRRALAAHPPPDREIEQ